MKSLFTLLIIIIISVFKLNADAQWSTDPNVNLTVCDTVGDQAVPKITAATDGGCYISWFDSRNGSYAVYLQRLNAQGVKQFPSSGILVSSNPQSSSLVDWDITCDDSNNAIIVFTDTRNGSSINPFAYKVSPSGVLQWGANGIQLSNDFTVYQANPRVAKATDGSFVVTWIYSSTPRKIAIQRLSSGGAKLWGTGGNPIYLASASTELFDYPSVITSDNGNVIMEWSGYTGSFLNPANYKIYSQKFSPAGTPVWNATQDTVYSLGRVTGFFVPKLISDNNNGAVYIWEDDRNNVSLRSCFVQRKTSAGAILFPVNGTELCTTGGENKFSAYAAVMPGTNDLYCVWNQTNSLQSLFGIYGQRVSPSGARMWTDAGKIFKPMDQNQPSFIYCYSKDTGFVASYTETTFGSSNALIKAFKTNKDGVMQWGGVIMNLSTYPSGKIRAVDAFTNGTLISAWNDTRNTSGIYAQDVTWTGTLGGVTGILPGRNEVPEKFRLDQNYPNPFNPSTVINYSLADASDVSLVVYDALGKEVKVLVSGIQSKGDHSVTFNGSGLASGIYNYRLIFSASQSDTKTMALIK
jgi:hypothetical protein